MENGMLKEGLDREWKNVLCMSMILVVLLPSFGTVVPLGGSGRTSPSLKDHMYMPPRPILVPDPQPVPTMYADGMQLSTSNVTPGHRNVPILQLNISNAEATADNLLLLNITSANSDDMDVEEVSLWMDTGDGIFNPLNDTRIWSGLFNMGRIELAPGLPIAALETTILYTAYNVSATAPEGAILDCFIGVGDILLENAGANQEAVNPEGHTTVKNSSIAPPQALYGYTWNASGQLSPMDLSVTNLRTTEVVETESNAWGEYIISLDILVQGFLIGDTFEILATDSENWGYNTTLLGSGFGTMLNVTLYEGPIASNPWPSNVTVADPQHPVNITILATQYPFDPTSVVLEAGGSNYTVDGINITYGGLTGNLLFNTSNAGILWAEGNNIITLWKANDTLGNPGQNLPYIWNFTLLSALVEERPDIRVNKQGDDLNITWLAVENATQYNLYLSFNVDGTGFDWDTPHATVENLYYVHEGANVDASNYSYIVRGVNLAGEGPSSNIGWKLRHNLIYEPVKRGGALNYIALPYFSSITTASELMDDIGPNCTAVSRWNLVRDADAGVWDDRIMIPGVGQFGPNFAIIPGEGYLVAVNTNITYILVGSYNPDVVINLLYEPIKRGGALNYIALPYHMSLDSASMLLGDLSNATAVSRWNLVRDADAGVWDDRIMIPGVGQFGPNFTLTPGEAYLVAVEGAESWIPPVPDI